jgi:hypothetical protein
MERPIEVVAWFPVDRRYPVPLVVVRDGVRERVERVHLVHERWSAGDLLLVYALTAGGSWLQLRFDTRRARWFLEESNRLEGA